MLTLPMLCKKCHRKLLSCGALWEKWINREPLLSMHSELQVMTKPFTDVCM